MNIPFNPQCNNNNVTLEKGVFTIFYFLREQVTEIITLHTHAKCNVTTVHKITSGE